MSMAFGIWGDFEKFRPASGFRWGNPGRSGALGGRLPFAFSRRGIKWRVPFSRSAELEIGPNETLLFAEKDFQINIDKPIEIHRLIVRLLPVTVSTLAGDVLPYLFDVVPDTLLECVKLSIRDLGKDAAMTRSNTVNASGTGLMKSGAFASNLLANDTGFWEWEEPYTLVRAESFQIQVESTDFPSFCLQSCSLVDDQFLRVEKLRLEICLQGYNIVIAPPSETR